MPYNEEGTLQEIKNLLETVKKLRAPDGCPWDREQTHQSLRPYLIEETYETIEVLDQVHSAEDLKRPSIQNAFKEEWGDVLLQILLHLEIASETEPALTFEAVVRTLREKLVRRHPHVFGSVQVNDSADVVKNWEQIKKSEKLENADPSAESAPLLLSSLPKGAPPLPKTMKLIKAVTKVGFQWPNVEGPLEKLSEEVSELREAVQEKNTADIENEIGDVLFSVCNIAHFYKIDPEAALRQTLRKFESRFNFVEQEIRKTGSSIEKSNLEQMDALWNKAKQKGL